MKVEDKRGLKRLLFDELYLGDVFEENGDIYMKISDEEGFRFSDETFEVFDVCKVVNKVKAKIVIED